MVDTPVPVLWSAQADETLDFYKAIGYAVVYAQTRPYVAIAVERNGGHLQFTAPPAGLPSPFESLGCLVAVDNVADQHRDLTERLRAHYGKIPAKGCPRITRFRPGQSRFTLVDPHGNYLLFIQRDEPSELEYGGSSELENLAKVLDNARILRDFKNDDKAAARVIEVGLRRFGPESEPVERGRALAMLAELAVAEGDSAIAAKYRAQVRELDLSAEDRAIVAAELQAGTDLEQWSSE
ncbi:glyoxalase [Nocardia sp. XZ_19_385]|uniref:glyoxalase n=1 Tax=Nocardia sp. XZ_19_385 TaxID=2769488 RepID=UPI00188E1F8E|nr:glyoxalase [Nocardia sp. XZ_19_385]